VGGGKKKYMGLEVSPSVAPSGGWKGVRAEETEARGFKQKKNRALFGDNFRDGKKWHTLDESDSRKIRGTGQGTEVFCIKTLKKGGGGVKKRGKPSHGVKFSNERQRHPRLGQSQNERNLGRKKKKKRVGKRKKGTLDEVTW